MTVKLVAMYRQPADVDGFLQHYHETHLPLVNRTPHLESAVVSRVAQTLIGEFPYFMIAEMRFPDRARFDEAMRSPENRAAGKDLMSFAADLVTLVVLEEEG